MTSDRVGVVADVRRRRPVCGLSGEGGVVMARCRDCHRPVLFVQITGSGRLLPVDAASPGEGNVVARLAAGKWRGHVLRAGESAPKGWRWFIAHPAVCEMKVVERRERKARDRVNAADVPLVLFDVPKFQTRRGA